MGGETIMGCDKPDKSSTARITNSEDPLEDSPDPAVKTVEATGPCMTRAHRPVAQRAQATHAKASPLGDQSGR